MKERPILFSALMIRALLAGTKTQTRRLMTPQPAHLQRHEWRGEVLYDAEHRLWWWKDKSFENLIDFESGRAELARFSPYGVAGDRLWCRETFTHITGNGIRVHYRADGEPTDRDGNVLPTEAGLRRWMPAIFMPRKASRITLEITGVRVQRLHDITEEDAHAEGVASGVIPPDDYGPHRIGYVLGDDDGKCTLYPTERAAFAEGWDKLNAGRAPWASNPWVWAVTFRRIEQPARAA